MTALSCLISVSFYAQDQDFPESHLPILIIQYENDIDEIPDEPRVYATMGIIDNGEGEINHIEDVYNVYSGNIGIETRGNSTQMFEKKTYTIELWDEDLEDQQQSLLGMAEEEDWILHFAILGALEQRHEHSRDESEYGS